MTETSYGRENISMNWSGIVINVTDDPDKEGRVQVRVFGQHDDTTNIPDKDLAWAKVSMGTDNAAHAKIGTNATGLIKGSIVSGHYWDADRQHPIITATIHKAGDEDSTQTNNGIPNLTPGTGSAPYDGSNPLVRSYWGPQVAKDNPLLAIENHDSANSTTSSSTGGQAGVIQQQKDSDPGIKTNDGIDPTAAGYTKGKKINTPTVGSISNPSGSILSQLQSVDPSHLTSILPQAVDAISKILDIHAFASTTGCLNVLGTAIGQVMNQIGLPIAIAAIGNGMTDGTQLTSQAQQALATALIGLGSNPVSSAVQSVINLSVGGISEVLSPLVNNNLLTEATFNSLTDAFLGDIQNNGLNQVIGANINNVLSQVQNLLPQISGAINNTLDAHLPTSVLNSSVVTQVLQKFAIQQALLKAPTTGLKALAMQATTLGNVANASAIGSALSQVEGVASSTISKITSLF